MPHENTKRSLFVKVFRFFFGLSYECDGHVVYVDKASCSAVPRLTNGETDEGRGGGEINRAQHVIDVILEEDEEEEDEEEHEEALEVEHKENEEPKDSGQGDGEQGEDNFVDSVVTSYSNQPPAVAWE